MSVSFSISELNEVAAVVFLTTASAIVVFPCGSDTTFSLEPHPLSQRAFLEFLSRYGLALAIGKI